MAHVAQFATVVKTNHESPEITTTLARFGVTANDNFRFQNGFNLQPVATSPLCIDAINAFRNHPFKRNLRDFLVELHAMFDDVIRVANNFVGFQNLLERVLTINQRAASKIQTIMVEQIENVVCQSCLRDEPFNFRLVLAAHARLQQLKLRDAMLIERDDLSIKN